MNALCAFRPATPLSPSPSALETGSFASPPRGRFALVELQKTYHGYFELEGDPAFTIRWLKIRLLKVRLYFLRKVQSGELCLLSTTMSRSRSPGNCKVSAHADCMLQCTSSGWSCSREMTTYFAYPSRCRPTCRNSKCQVTDSRSRTWSVQDWRPERSVIGRPNSFHT